MHIYAYAYAHTHIYTACTWHISVGLFCTKKTTSSKAVYEQIFGSKKAFFIKLSYKSVYVAFETIYAKLFKLLKLN